MFFLFIHLLIIVALLFLAHCLLPVMEKTSIKTIKKIKNSVILNNYHSGLWTNDFDTHKGEGWEQDLELELTELKKYDFFVVVMYRDISANRANA